MSYSGRLIISIEGLELTKLEEEIIAHPMTAGVILFTRNFKTLVQLKNLLNAIQTCARYTANQLSFPILVDQEGGAVQRFTKEFTTPLPALEFFGTAYDLDPQIGLKLATTYGYRMARPLVELGIISLAPVLDLQAGNEIITGLGRAFHADPTICSILAEAYIDGMHAAGMLATGKHFPGHGQNIGDSHAVAPIDPRNLTEISQTDLQPFLHLIAKNKLAAIMPAHITYPKVDPDHIVGMSKIWLKDLLREKYNFDGVIISDCLSMVGAGQGSYLDKVKKALIYCDLVILSNLADYKEYLPILDALSKPKYQSSTQTAARVKRWVENSVLMNNTIHTNK